MYQNLYCISYLNVFYILFYQWANVSTQSQEHIAEVYFKGSIKTFFQFLNNFLYFLYGSPGKYNFTYLGPGPKLTNVI